jgi:hypothetical protein
MLLAAASMRGGSDDEPWAAEIALRNYMADALSEKVAARCCTNTGAAHFEQALKRLQAGGKVLLQHLSNSMVATAP